MNIVMQGVDSELEDTRKTEREEQVKDKCSSGRQVGWDSSGRPMGEVQNHGPRLQRKQRRLVRPKAPTVSGRQVEDK